MQGAHGHTVQPHCTPAPVRNPSDPGHPHQVELVEVSVTSVIHSSHASKSSLQRSSCWWGGGQATRGLLGGKVRGWNGSTCAD